MKTIKLFLSIICYFGTSVIYVDKQLEGAIAEALRINPLLQRLILALLIVFWIIRIIWFIYDKFYLESKERKQAMREIEAKHK